MRSLDGALAVLEDAGQGLPLLAGCDATGAGLGTATGFLGGLQILYGR